MNVSSEYFFSTRKRVSEPDVSTMNNSTRAAISSVGFDDDLAAQTTQASNRIRCLLTQIHPALERVIGPRLDHPAVLELLQRYPSPEKLT